MLRFTLLLSASASGLWLLLSYAAMAQAADCELGAYADGDYKKEFAEKFAVAFQSLAFSFIDGIVSEEVRFYNTVYEEAKTPNTPLSGIKAYSEALGALSRQLPDAQNDARKLGDVIRKYYNSTLNVVRLLRREGLSLDDFDVQSLADRFSEIIDEFRNETLSKWNELFAQVPQDELNAFSGYSEVNASMQKLSNEKSFRIATFNDAINAVSMFFHYPYWRDLFPKRTQRM